jgi:hypothetical protein
MIIAITGTYHPPHCHAAISFDLMEGTSDTDITVRDNVRQSTAGMLPLLPDGAQQ